VVQERLKELGDWVEFPRTVDQVAALMQSGRLARASVAGVPGSLGRNAVRSHVRQPTGRLLLDGAPVEDLFLQDKQTAEGT
jgi:hypothetical protein